MSTAIDTSQTTLDLYQSYTHEAAEWFYAARVAGADADAIQALKDQAAEHPEWLWIISDRDLNIVAADARWNHNIPAWIG